MRVPPSPLLPLLLMTASCGAAPLPAPAPPPAQLPAPAPAQSAPPATSAAAQVFADPPPSVPAFDDPHRRDKILAAIPKLDAHFAARATGTQLPGLVVGLVVDADLVWSKGYGVRDLTSKEPVDADTLFRLASVTKSFTAAAILQLRDAGKLSLEDPADRYLPELAGIVYPTRDSPRITLRHVLTHGAGLPRDSPLPLDPDHPHSEAEVLASLQGMTLESAPGSVHSYSNLGFHLAGMVVSRVSGQPYAEYLTTHVLRPLGMTSTSFDPSADRLATGYVRQHEAIVHPPMIHAGASPAGGLFSSVRDLARYAAFELAAWPPRDDPDDGPLARSSVREAQRMAIWDRMVVPPREAAEEQHARARGYGFGWVAEQTCDFDAIVWHNGGLTDGYHAMVLMLPDRGVALVGMTNLFDPQAGLEQSFQDALHLLDVAGALPRRVLTPGPALIGARDTILSLRERWDDALAARTFVAPEMAAFQKKDLSQGLLDHGACHVVSTTAESPLELRWELACERGGQLWHTVLGAKDGRVHWNWPEEWFPPDPRVAKAAARIAGLVQRWDDKVWDAVVAAAVDRSGVEAVFARAAPAHGSCKVDHAQEHGNKMHARFVLSCARGRPVELRVSLDDKSGKVTEVALGTPAEPGKRCP